ncbi:MAG TPA: magnesium/cobalt transporter CorA [Anaerolineae bacterium]
MVRILHALNDGNYRTDLEPGEIAPILQRDDGFIWIDLSNEPVSTSDFILRDIFNFHPLAIDDALHEVHLPKLDDWQAYLYIVLHGVHLQGNNRTSLFISELDIFLGHNYIVTYHEAPVPTIDRIWDSCHQDERLRQNGPDHLLYRLADELVNDYISTIEQLEEMLDQLEISVFSQPTRATPEKIFTLKRMVLRMRRVVAPQREVLNKLARDPYTMIDPADRIFFRDVYDHFIRLYDLIDNLRDLVTSALETYLSVVNNRMNDIMKTLTVFATLFMPLTFVTGFFGMNFFQPNIPLEFWTGRVMFVVMLLIMVLIPVSMYWWMRRRAWM